MSIEEKDLKRDYISKEEPINYCGYSCENLWDFDQELFAHQSSSLKEKLKSENFIQTESKILIIMNFTKKSFF